MTASFTYDSFFDDVFKGNITVSGDTFFMMLVTSAYTPLQATDTKQINVSGEVVGPGYTTSGLQVTATISKNTGSNQNIISFSSPSWSNASITAYAGVIYDKKGAVPANNPLVAYAYFGGNVTSTSGTFTATEVSGLTVQN